MSRPLVVLFVFAVLSPGCVPVTEPVGDIDKAEPDKNLLGSWVATDSSGTELVCVVDRPEVKGNPKGLMRLTASRKGKKPNDAEESSSLWFFVTPVRKHAYANVLLALEERPIYARLGEEGAYAAWRKKDESHGYGVVRLELGTDRCIVGYGDEGIVKLMKANQIGKSGEIFYQTPVGWFAKHLEKYGPDGLFRDELTFTRPQKK